MRAGSRTWSTGFAGCSRDATEAQETAGIVGMFMLDAEPVEKFTTYGDGGQRYEAAVALQRSVDEHDRATRSAVPATCATPRPARS